MSSTLQHSFVSNRASDKQRYCCEQDYQRLQGFERLSVWQRCTSTRSAPSTSILHACTSSTILPPSAPRSDRPHAPTTSAVLQSPFHLSAEDEDGSLESTTAEDHPVECSNLENNAEHTFEENISRQPEPAAPQPVRVHRYAPFNSFAHSLGAKIRWATSRLSDTGLYRMNGRLSGHQRAKSAIPWLARARLWDTDAHRSKSGVHNCENQIQDVHNPQDANDQTAMCGGHGGFGNSFSTGSGWSANNSNNSASHRNGKQPMQRGNDGYSQPTLATATSTPFRPMLRFPCVFHLWGFAEDPTGDCATKHKYCSQITPHHRAQHEQHACFFYCLNCFKTSRDSPISHHGDGTGSSYTCQRRCVTQRCRNYDCDPADSGSPYSFECAHEKGHKNDQWDIWRKLYRLAHGLGKHDWAPDPNVVTQIIPPNLPASHPMAAFYHPTAPPHVGANHDRSQLRTIQPRPAPLPQETVQDMEAQRVFSGDILSTFVPNTTLLPLGVPVNAPPLIPSPGDRLHTGTAYSDQPLSSGDTERSSRLRDVTALARRLWPIVASPNPTMQSIPAMTQSMLRDLPPHPPQIASDTDLATLRKLISQYENIILNPMSRSLIEWHDILYWTKIVLENDIDPTQDCPWQLLQQSQEFQHHPVAQTSPLWQDLPSQAAQLSPNVTISPQILPGTGDAHFTTMHNTHLNAAPWQPAGSTTRQVTQNDGSVQTFHNNFLIPPEDPSQAFAHQQPSSASPGSFSFVNRDTYSDDNRPFYSDCGSEFNLNLSRTGSRNGSAPGRSDTSGQYRS